MSNTLLDNEALDDMTSELRAETPVKPFVKPPIHVEGAPSANRPEDVLTPEQIIAVSKLFQQKAAETIRQAAYDPNAEVQFLTRDKVVITDFSKITIDDVYDLSVPIEAKPFMSADSLHIVLKDSNYEARWVNKNSQNLGNKMAKGFTYVCFEDLLNETSIQTSKDAEGHYVFDDVVAMKIDKATYYKALRAAHERAVATTDTANSRKRAANQAQGYMNRESGVSNDYQEAARAKKMVFYDPGVEV